MGVPVTFWDTCALLASTSKPFVENGCQPHGKRILSHTRVKTRNAVPSIDLGLNKAIRRKGSA